VTAIIYHREFLLPGLTVDLEVAYFSLQKVRERDSQDGLDFEGMALSHKMP
jgi:hypothetical protein